MQQFDFIIIGTGAGGGTLLHKLSNSGKRILVLERGSYLPSEKENWDTIEVFKNERYHTKEIWKTNGTEELHPGTGYWVGGNTKVYGAALFRLREKDFTQIEHSGGFSPAWPIQYADLEKYYTEAENIYQVHGKMGLDPTEAYRSSAYPFAPVSHEPRIQEIADSLSDKGLHPFYIPLGIKLNEADKEKSECIRCNTCDGFPCKLHAKCDADINCVQPSVKDNNNITLLTNAKVIKLNTNATGTQIVSVDVEIDGAIQQFAANIFVLSAGAVNSAALLLKSATDKHLHGLANASGQVGRNFMKHQNAAMMAISTKINPTIFQKTLAITDFYWGDDEYKYPMGCIQLMGKANKDMMRSDAPFFTPGMVLEEMAEHSIDWWLTGEDLPTADNRVQFINGEIHLDYKENNTEGFDRLQNKWKQILGDIDSGDSFIPHGIYLRKTIPLSGVAHQCGTVRFGLDAKTSVLDINCKAHELDNLYVVDGSFFPSSGAVNPSLTIMANALRVGEHLLERVK